MSTHGSRLEELLRNYSNDQATEIDIREMLRLLQQDKDNVSLGMILRELRAQAAGRPSSPDADWELIWQDIYNKTILAENENMKTTKATPLKRSVSPRLYYWRMVAAAAVVLLFIGMYLMWPRDHGLRRTETAKGQAATLNNDKAPGRMGAVLTLADGSRIMLDSTANGLLATQGATEVSNSNRQLIYRKGTGREKEVIYNTLTTARGQQYPLALSDGTKVWLNSASSIRFPVSFSGKERRVEVSGEAYFEVASVYAPAEPKGDHKKLPFIVKITGNRKMPDPLGATEIQVLGTHFNINAYDDEPVAKTTLLEGVVQVTKGGENHLLQPGWQAQQGSFGGISVIKDVDVEEVIAWKNGYFQFTEADLPSLIRQLSRWYDLEPVYEGRIREHAFTGKISRNVTLASLLKALRISGVSFRIEGNRLIVIS